MGVCQHQVTIARLNRYLLKNDIPAMALAEYLGLSRSTLSKWRERRAIPKRLHPLLEELVVRPRESVLRHRSRRSPAPF